MAMNEKELRVGIKKKFRRLVRMAYYDSHQACPKCQEITFHGLKNCEFIDLETAKDVNCCTCSCGWSGIVHDLVEPKEE